MALKVVHASIIILLKLDGILLTGNVSDAEAMDPDFSRGFNQNIISQRLLSVAKFQPFSGWRGMIHTDFKVPW